MLARYDGEQSGEEEKKKKKKKKLGRWCGGRVVEGRKWCGFKEKGDG